MNVLRNLAVRTVPARSVDTGESIYQRFDAAPDCLLIAVVDDADRPIGLIERNTFFIRFARHYGRALFASRSIDLIMDRSPLTVEADMPPGDFASVALDGHAGQLLKGFIIVENGVYLGVGAALDLLRAAAVERLETAKKLSDLTKSLQASHLEAERNRLFAEAVIEHIPSLVTVRSETTGRFMLVNRAGEAMLGVGRADLVGRTTDDVSPEPLGDQMRLADRMLGRKEGSAAVRDLPFVRPLDGDRRLFRMSQTPVPMPDGERLILTVADDVTDARRAEARIEHLAHFDILTALPNRALFQERLDHCLNHTDAARADGGTMETAVLAIDIDRFKSVNDTMGHSAGDALLRAIAERLREVLRADDVAARLGGDEFAILVSGEQVEEKARAIADRVTHLLSQPFDLGGSTANLGASIGIALYPVDAQDGAELLKRADIALYRAKAEGKGIWRRFDPSMNAELRARRALEHDLRRAVENGDFEAHFQPIVNLGQNRIAGFEALMRWPHQERGMVPPNIFIPLAEEIGLINPMGEWMVRAACEVASHWPVGVKVAVNVSAVQFRSPGLVSTIFQALSRARLSPDRLELEVTETVIMEDEPQVLKSLRQLREMGVSISLDDFGTGFASLSYLQRFPFDKIKIDQSFTRDLPGSRAAASIISAVTAMAGQLGMITTAEGVETQEQLAEVTRLGCTQAQGYLIGKASARPEDFLKLENPRALIVRAAS